MAIAAITREVVSSQKLELSKIADFPCMRVLYWDRDVLYASCGYEVLAAKVNAQGNLSDWKFVGQYRPSLSRRCTSATRLISRLFRDGFHALTVLSSEHIIGAVPGSIVRRLPGENEFRVCHRVSRGTRPLHITRGWNDQLFWGEYFDNSERSEVNIYGSTDQGEHWEPVYTFPAGAIRHVHNVVFDPWAKCYWVLTGDEGNECQILRASLDFRNLDTVVAGNQQARCAALTPTREALYFSSDTPFEQNHIYRLDRNGSLTAVAEISGSSIYSCTVSNSFFFATMVEPNKINFDKNVRLYASADGSIWESALGWKKDIWPARFFQYGNAFLPDGLNTSNLLAITTIAVCGADQVTSIYCVDR